MITIDEVRKFAMTLPRTTEGLVGGRVKFYVGRIVYVSFSHDGTVMGFGFPKEERDWLVGGSPEKFMLPSGGDLRYHWVLARLSAIDETEMHELVLKRESTRTLADAARRHGMRTLGQSGWEKVKTGLTTLEEVLRVITVAEK